MTEGSWVGLDVHARATVAGVLDAVTGELRLLQRVPPRSEETVEWKPARSRIVALGNDN